MSARRRAKQDRRRRRKNRNERLTTLAVAHARALGCTCAPRATLATLPVGAAVRVQHVRGCPRWESIRPGDGIDVVTGQLSPIDDGGEATA